MNLRALAAEFIGTFALIFVGMLVGHHLGDTKGGLLGIALGHGLAIAILGSATGAISGGHLNPAVSFALLITGRISGSTFASYVIAQLFGAFAAALTAGFLVSEPAFVAGQTHHGGCKMLAQACSKAARCVRSQSSAKLLTRSFGYVVPVTHLCGVFCEAVVL